MIDRYFKNARRMKRHINSSISIREYYQQEAAELVSQLK